MVLFKVDKEEVIERTRKTYAGPLEIGEDLMVFDIGPTVRVTRPPDRLSLAKPSEIVPEL
jgi:ribonuclease Z